MQAGAAPGVVRDGATGAVMPMLATTAGAMRAEVSSAADITELLYAARVASMPEAFVARADSTVEVVSMGAVADSMVEAGSTAAADIANV